MKNIKLTLLAIALFAISFIQGQTNYYTRVAGAWNDNTSVWSTVSHSGAACSCNPGNSLAGSNTVYIYNTVSSFGSLSSIAGSGKIIVETGDSLIITTSNLSVSASGGITVNSGGILIINGALTMAGSSSITNNGSMYVYGNISNSGSATVTDNGSLTVHGDVTTSGSASFTGSGTSYVIGTVTGPNTSMLSMLPAFFSSFLTASGKGLVGYNTSPSLIFQPLKYDNDSTKYLSGNGTFQPIPPTPFTPWQQSGSNTYYNGGNVGIGTTHPNYPLQIVGNVVDSGSIFVTNLAVQNTLSIGNFKLVKGVVMGSSDTIASTAVNSIFMNAMNVTAKDSLKSTTVVTQNLNVFNNMTVNTITGTTVTAGQTVTAGTTSPITIDGNAGTITSPTGIVSFGNNTIATTGAIQAGSFQASFFKTDSIQTSTINLKDSILTIGDPLMQMNFHANNINQVCLTCPVTTSLAATGISYGNAANFCNFIFGIGTNSPDAGLTVSSCQLNKQFSVYNPNTGDVFTIDASGNTNVWGKVVIGNGLTTPGNYGLYVGNGVLTSVVKIALPSDNVNWSDYVFANNYKLKPLTEVAQYINENKHLPEVPSADDIKKDGINVADMDATLLKKIEELTLYMIQQQKQSEEQKQVFERQQKEIQDLKAQLAKLQNKQK